MTQEQEILFKKKVWDYHITENTTEYEIAKHFFELGLEAISNMDIFELLELEKQGESDETKAKKFLINRGYPIDANGVFPTYEEMYNIIREGLENQAEQNPVDNLEPKFHKGDLIIHQGTENIYQVVALIDNQYQLKYGDTYTIQNCVDVDRCARLWNITKDYRGESIMKPKTLQFKLRDVALEYMRKVADMLGRYPLDCHWVGTDDHERGIYTICDFGDTTFLTLDQMQVIIDRLPDWLKRYGTRNAVAQEIENWIEWSIKEENRLDGYPRINLEHWLMGCPREPKTYTTVDDKIQQHRDILSVLGTVRGFYGNIPVVQAIDNIQARIRELEARKRIEDESAFDKIKDTEAYKHFRKMMEDEI